MTRHLDLKIDEIEREAGEERLHRLRKERLLSPTLKGRRLSRTRALLSGKISPYRFAVFALRRLVQAVERRFKPVSGQNEKASPDDRSVYIAIRVTGGIGDVVVLLRWIRQFITARTYPVTVDLYFHDPSAIRFMATANGLREVLPAWKFDGAKFYDFVLTLSQFVSFHWDAMDYVRLSQLAPDLIAFAADIEEKNSSYSKFIAQHPFLDGAFADRIVLEGADRKTFLSSLSGFPSPDTPLQMNTVCPDASVIEKIGDQYITIHDGWDTGYILTSDRPTKAYFIDHFESVVALIKASAPALKIVQLGTKLGSPISGVDLDLRGMTTVAEVAYILARSGVHIDAESGLVHIATSLGVHCVTLFGPTNLKYYGYAENTNLAPLVCGNCMWSTDLWMDSCPAGFGLAACMRSIAPERVAAAALAVLRSS